MSLIKIENASLGYEGKTVVNDISVDIKEKDYICIVGENGSGKTTLICNLIKEFVNMGKSVAVIKHTSHDHSFDTDGKDTYNFKLNGASATLIYSPLKYMIVKDYKKSGNEEENTMSFINDMKEYDIIIVEVRV